MPPYLRASARRLRHLAPSLGLTYLLCCCHPRDVSAYLPDDWAADRKRRQKTSVPTAVTFATRPIGTVMLLSRPVSLPPHFRRRPAAPGPALQSQDSARR